MAYKGPKELSIDGNRLIELMDVKKITKSMLSQGTRDYLTKALSERAIDKIIKGEIKHPRFDKLNAIINVLIKELGFTEKKVKKLIGYDEIDPPKKYYTDIKNLYKDKFEELKKYWIESKVIEYDKFGPTQESKNEPVNLIKAAKENIKNNNLVLYGESGLGKSVSCLKLIDTLHNDNSNKLVPLYIKLNLSNGDIENTIQEKKKKYGLKKENLIIFLDGLNEVGDYNEQQKILLQINKYVLENPNHRIIITTQILNDPIKNLENYKFFSIQPFDSEDIIKYLGKFKDKFKTKKEAQEFFDDFDYDFKKFISVPKLLNILVTIYDEKKNITVRRQIQLYNEYEDFLCGGRADRIEMNEEIRKYFIPYLAHKMSLNLQTKISSEQLNGYINEFNINPAHPKLIFSEVKNSLIKNYNILNMYENDEYEFIHDLIRGYFTGKYWKSKDYDSKTLIKNLSQDSEVNLFLLDSLKFYVGLADEYKAKNLIKSFIDLNVGIACELFLWVEIKKFDTKFIKEIISKLLKKGLSEEEYFSVLFFYFKIFGNSNSKNDKELKHQLDQLLTILSESYPMCDN